MTNAPDLFDVAVVGFGPVGAVAANLLGQSGLRTVVIDKATEVTPFPRAVAFDHEIMRLFQNIGVADEIGEFIIPYAETEYRGADGEAIARFKSKPAPFALGWEPNFLFNQPPVENAIRMRAGSYPSLTVLLGKSLEAFYENPDSTITLHLRRTDGSSRLLTAHYMIACDGATSTVRRALNIPLLSLDFDRPFLVVDALVREPALSRLPAINIQYCEPERPTTYLLGPHGHRRWEIMLLDGERPEDANHPAFIRRMLSRWITHEDGELLRAASYEFHALIAERWRQGHIFLAGDAAHQTPPFMGQGMCQGLRDVSNLVWKIQRVRQGTSTETLLDSYEIERIPHVRTTTENAIALGRTICEIDPVKAATRDAELRAAYGNPPRLRIRQDLVPPLRHGLLLQDDSALAGCIVPQPFIATGEQPDRRFDDVAGTRFRLILTEDLANRMSGNMISEFSRLGGDVVGLMTEDGKSGPANATMLRERDRHLQSWLAAAGCQGAIVRPDHYVYAGVSNHEALAYAILQLKKDLAAK